MSTQGPQIILLAAVAQNGVIGRDNRLPWRLRADLQHFRRTTTGHAVLMGRKTWQSLPRALPERDNLVLSRDANFTAPGARTFTTLAAALQFCREAEKVFIIGGGELYRQTLPLADGLLITEVKADIAGDTRFPAVDWTHFSETAREHIAADADNEFACDFVSWQRIQADPAASAIQ